MKFRYDDEAKVTDEFYGDDLVVQVKEYDGSSESIGGEARYFVVVIGEGPSFWANESQLKK